MTDEKSGHPKRQGMLNDDFFLFQAGDAAEEEDGDLPL